MVKKLNAIRAKAIEARERLTSADVGDQSLIVKLDRIILGTVLVKWMHRFAAVFFIVFAAVFISLVYPDPKFMTLMAGFAAGGYAICLLGVVVQMKLYNRTIGKVRATLKTG